jgi:hypothetical protein
MAEEIRTWWDDGDLVSPGPYEAIVVSHFDPYQMGSLEVQLLKSTSSGNTPEVSGQTIIVKYLSPFYGVTNLGHNTKNEGYSSTQKSYGFWAVPPDIGTTVLVVFAEGRITNGYWIGCVQDSFMNFMVPDGRPSTTYNSKGENLPVGEFNKLLDTPQRRTEDPTRFLKPVNDDFTSILETQGLKQDYARGLTTTSARRETPSAVFGISTPGPLDKRSNAPKGPYGTKDSKAEVFVNRLGGSSFVMDDGDEKYIRKTPSSEGPMEYAYVLKGEKGNVELPANELVRIRTRTGHQILLHNTEDLIYIANAKGTSWIELTSDGKIDIYAEDSISVHTKQDINFKADRDINLEAGRNVNIKANANINMQSIKEYNLIIGADGKISTVGNINFKTNGNHIETATNIHMNGPAAAPATPLSMHSLPGEPQKSIMKRIPQHEPWPHHENINGTLFKPDKTDRDSTTAIPTPAIPKLYDVFKGGKA